MMQFRKMKGLAVLLSICILLGMINTKVYASDEILLSDHKEEETILPAYDIGGAEAESRSVIYVGGPDAASDGDGSSTKPFRTVREAASAINIKGPGSYEIVMLGSTIETDYIYIGNDVEEYDVKIKAAAVSGGAITITNGIKVKRIYLIYIYRNATLSVEGSSPSELLIFDGNGEANTIPFPLINVSIGATFNLNAYASVQNNINYGGYAGYEGGGISNYGTVNINGGSVTNNRGLKGGGIENYGRLIINSGNISHNYSSNSGGGIYNHAGSDFTLNNGIIAYNTANVRDSGITNYGNMTMNGGYITQNSGASCLTNHGTITMNNGEISSNIGDQTILNDGSGTFHMIDGKIINNTYMTSYKDYIAVKVAGGMFTFSGGSIDNNIGEKIVEVHDASFHMNGGTINNNTASSVINTYPEATFTMSDGEISENSGLVFSLNGPISLSGNASISGKDGESGKVLIDLENIAYINVSGLLNNISSLSIGLNKPRAGAQILAGPMLTEDIRAKFVIEDTKYILDDTGRLAFNETPFTFYVDKAGSDEESVIGSSGDPLLTIEEAVKRIGSSNGTIIIQSDMELTKPININTHIVMKSDNATRVIKPNLPYSAEYSSVFIVEEGLLTLGDKNQTEGELVIDVDNQKEVLNSLIKNDRGIVYLYDRAVIRNAKFATAAIDNLEALTNIDGGSIYSINVAIRNSMGTVNVVSGTISGYENKFEGLINDDDKAIVNILGGTIAGYKDGIYNKGTLNISEGLICTNTNGISNISYTSKEKNFEGTLNILGGVISDNTYSINNAGRLNISHNPSIPVGANNSNGIYLSNNKITLSKDFYLRDGKKILIVLDEYKLDDVVLIGDKDSIINNHDSFMLSDSKYGISETGTIRYIGEVPVYYVDASYTLGDSDGSLEKPYASLKAAVSYIDKTTRAGRIYICSDVEVNERITINNDITILNYGPDPHTITTNYNNRNIEISDRGSLTLGLEGEGEDEPHKLLIYGKFSETIMNEGILKLYSGVKMYGKEDKSSYNSAVYNKGTFYMFGGDITGFRTRGEVGGVTNNGSFIMEGGKISNCEGTMAGALYNNYYGRYAGKFIMKGGRIEDNNSNYGAGIYNDNAVIHLSENASIPMKEDGSNKLFLCEKSVINIDTDLRSTDSIIIAARKYLPGRQVLQGDKTVLLSNYQKFIVDPTVTDYCIAEDGTLKYIGLTMDYYVDEKNGDNNNTGTKDLPFATLKKAVEAIGSGVGTIHICSDIDQKETITINGAIKLISEGEPHIILRNPSLKRNLFVVKGQLELGNSELNGEPEVRLLTINGNNENVRSDGAIIYNDGGRVILHNGVVLEDNFSYDLGGGISNRGGYNKDGTITMNGGVIQNNTGYFTGGGICSVDGNVTILGGSIRNNQSDRDGGGIYHEGSGFISISGGSIHDNKANRGGGIRLYDGNIRISGGKIHNNKASKGGGLLLSRTYNYDCIISGGEIFGNTGLDEEGIGKGIDLEDFILTIEGNPSIASDNEIALWNTDYWYGKSIVVVGGSLSKDIPAITLAKYDSFGYGNSYTYIYPIGEQVIKPANGYTLTAQDISKFQMLNSDYGINSRGNIAINLKDNWFSLEGIGNIKYTGKEIKPTVVGFDNKSTLIEGRDYQVTYTNNINPGIASVYITGMGRYGGTVIKNFTIRNSWIPYTPPSGGDFPAPTPIPDGPIEEVDVETSVKIGPREEHGTLNAIISISPDSIKSLDGVSGRSMITIPIEAEELIDQIQDEAVTGVNIDLVLPNTITQNSAVAGSRILIDPDILRAARASEKDISFTVRDEDGKERYSWSFSGSDLAASDKEIEELDLSFSIQSVEENEELAKLLGASQTGNGSHSGLIINFGHNGDLPAQARIRIYVGDRGYLEGDKLYLYHYNPETGKLDTLPYSSNYVVDSEGYITINIVHCSEYVLLPIQARSSIITSLRNQINVATKKITLNLGSKKKGTANIQVNLPKTLERVKNLKDKTAGSAVGAVTITYKSGNSKVASVDNKGKITAKKAGKTYITIKITLYSGKTKTYKVPVTVKKA